MHHVWTGESSEATEIEHRMQRILIFLKSVIDFIIKGRKWIIYLGFEASSAVSMKVAVLWVVGPCSAVEV
jgi:hypothetical protein